MESWSLINTISEAVELIEEVGSPAVGIQFDVWHLWNTPDLLDEIEREAHRFVGVHINDYRSPTRGFADRVLPGDGVADVASILRALDRAGWSGYYDLEVFSDNGAWGTVVPRCALGRPSGRAGRPGSGGVRRRVGGAAVA